MNDDVFRAEDGRWYFWDVWGQYTYGPYETEDGAAAAREDYLKKGEVL